MTTTATVLLAVAATASVAEAATLLVAVLHPDARRRRDARAALSAIRPPRSPRS